LREIGCWINRGSANMSDVTHILSQIEQGDPAAADKLLPLVYDELRKLAGHRVAKEEPGQTLQATGLVHEAYLRLVDVDNVQHWDSRGHFFAAAAEAMRRILVENARRKQCEKRGGPWNQVELADIHIPATPRDEQLIALDEALTRLADIRPQAAALVQLRFFGGQTIEEAAVFLELSERTARRLWVFAQAWLRRELEAIDHGKELADN
jgi:RNA polymerase sigma factor (TIGR02999 family)